MNEQVSPVTDLIRRFAAEYVIDFNARAAADRAGIAEGTAHSALNDPRVKALIDESKRRASMRVDVSVDNVLETLRQVGTVSIADYFSEKPDAIRPGVVIRELKPFSEWTDAMKRACKSIKQTKYGPHLELHSVVDTSVHIGKFFGMFTDNLRLQGANGGPVEYILPNMTPQEAADAYAKTLADE